MTQQVSPRTDRPQYIPQSDRRFALALLAIRALVPEGFVTPCTRFNGGLTR